MKYLLAILLSVSSGSLIVGPVFAAGEVVITQKKAVEGGIPGDVAGFPITITNQGVYQFASDIVVPADKIGIQVKVPYVTIDLNGFLLHGGNTAINGITGAGNAVNVRNGTIGHFKYDGINSTANYWVIENMTIVENGRNGVVLKDFARILHSTISANGNNGVQCNDICHIEGNNISANLKFGISVLLNGTAIGNTIMKNTDSGINAQTDESKGIVAFTNNALHANNGGGYQIKGKLYDLQPNLCDFSPC